MSDWGQQADTRENGLCFGGERERAHLFSMGIKGVVAALLVGLPLTTARTSIVCTASSTIDLATGNGKAYVLLGSYAEVNTAAPGTMTFSPGGITPTTNLAGNGACAARLTC